MTNLVNGWVARLLEVGFVIPLSNLDGVVEIKRCDDPYLVLVEDKISSLKSVRAHLLQGHKRSLNENFKFFYSMKVRMKVR